MQNHRGKEVEVIETDDVRFGKRVEVIEKRFKGGKEPIYAGLGLLSDGYVVNGTELGSHWIIYMTMASAN